MKTRIAILLTTGVLAGCASRVETPTPVPSRTTDSPSAVERTPMPMVVVPGPRLSRAATVEAYKHEMAQHISQQSAAHIYPGRPQALLRSVIVLRYAVDAGGRLIRAEIQRSNGDRQNEATALASLRAAAPFAAPARHWLRNGQLELSETWLFNNDGRFQLRSVAQPQMNQ